MLLLIRKVPSSSSCISSILNISITDYIGIIAHISIIDRSHNEIGRNKDLPPNVISHNSHDLTYIMMRHIMIMHLSHHVVHIVMSSFCHPIIATLDIIVISEYCHTSILSY